MHSNETREKFIKYRAKGWSLARIAAKIDVSKRTLIDWNCQHSEELRAFRAIELEALQEKLLATAEHELTWMTQMLSKTEETLMGSTLKYQPIAQVWRMHIWLGAELDKRRIAVESVKVPADVTQAQDQQPPELDANRSPQNRCLHCLHLPRHPSTTSPLMRSLTNMQVFTA